MKPELNIYLVDLDCGEVKELEYPTDMWDGKKSIQVLAHSEQEALELASAYNAGRTDYDNVCWNGEIIIAIMTASYLLLWLLVLILTL